MSLRTATKTLWVATLAMQGRMVQLRPKLRQIQEEMLSKLNVTQ